MYQTRYKITHDAFSDPQYDSNCCPDLHRSSYDKWLLLEDELSLKEMSDAFTLQSFESLFTYVGSVTDIRIKVRLSTGQLISPELRPRGRKHFYILFICSLFPWMYFWTVQ